MNDSKIFLVIATKDRVQLLERTLESIAHCLKPNNYGGLVLIENGPVQLLQGLVNGSWRERFENLNIHYSYRAIANKSAALNSILNTYRNHYLYFLDDDVRLAQNTILEMAQTISAVPDNVYLGGPIEIDYDLPPSDWLIKYLPWSAKGFRINTNHNSSESPNFLGANWLARADDLIRAGGFEEFRGPSEIASGQETEMEVALKRAGNLPYYVEKAMVWHYVPEERCTPEWTLNRAIPHSAAIGISAVDSERELPLLVHSFFALIGHLFMAYVVRGPRDFKEQYHYQFKIRAHWGKLRGIHYRWKYAGSLTLWRSKAFKRLGRQLVRPFIKALNWIELSVLGFIKSTVIRRDPLEFSLRLAKNSMYHRSSIPFSLYTTSACGLHCAHCIMLNQMKAEADYHLSLEELERFLDISQKSRYRFDIVLTGGEPLVWKNFQKGVEMLRHSPVCNTLRLFTNAMNPERIDAVTASYFDEIRISRYRENPVQALQLWKKYPSVVRMVSRTEFWKAPKVFYESRLPALCLNPEQMLFKDRIYACPHSESIATLRKKTLKLSNPLEPGFLKGISTIRKNQEREICAFCISNAKVRQNSKKVNNIGLRGWTNLNPDEGFSGF